jgi:DNA-directed RNA polymerase specialized sigma24 family protein
MRAGGSATCKVSAERLHEEEFDELRPSAFAIAYRMLSSVSEAEDTVQEGFLRLHRRAPARLAGPSAR